jgi:ribonucleoside-diphosphate reductase alpha chain
MRIQRRFTTSGQSPYAHLRIRQAVSEIRNPDGSIVFRQDGIEVPGGLEPGRHRRAGAKILP